MITDNNLTFHYGFYTFVNGIEQKEQKRKPNVFLYFATMISFIGLIEFSFILNAYQHEPNVYFYNNTSKDV